MIDLDFARAFARGLCRSNVLADPERPDHGRCLCDAGGFRCPAVAVYGDMIAAGLAEAEKAGFAIARAVPAHDALRRAQDDRRTDLALRS